MLAAETVKGYAAIRSAEYRAVARAEEYVAWAQDMLEAGLDSPALLRLAIVDPPWFTPDLRRLFDRAVEELEIEPLAGEQALILHAQQVAQELLAATVPPLEAGSLIVEILTVHDAPPGLGQWSLVDEANWCDYCRDSFAGAGRTLEQAILEEATKLLALDWRAYACRAAHSIA